MEVHVWVWCGALLLVNLGALGSAQRMLASGANHQHDTGTETETEPASKDEMKAIFDDSPTEADAPTDKGKSTGQKEMPSENNKHPPVMEHGDVDTDSELQDIFKSAASAEPGDDQREDGLQQLDDDEAEWYKWLMTQRMSPLSPSDHVPAAIAHNYNEDGGGVEERYPPSAGDAVYYGRSRIPGSWLDYYRKKREALVGARRDSALAAETSVAAREKRELTLADIDRYIEQLERQKLAEEVEDMLQDYYEAKKKRQPLLEDEDEEEEEEEV